MFCYSNRMDPSTQIQTILEQAIAEHVFPGAVVGYLDRNTRLVVPAGRLSYDAGDEAVTADTVYDLASLTKSIPTSSIIMKLIEQGKLALSDSAKQYIPELCMPNAASIQIRHLLTFTVEFKLEQRLSAYATEGKDQILKAIFEAPLAAQPGSKYMYSNTPYLLLGIIAERVSGKPLDKLADDMFFRPLGMQHTTFHPAQLEARVAPTEIVDSVTVHRQVHDESARALYRAGHISGHAGLFSTAGDLLIFGDMLLQGGVLDGTRYFSEQTMTSMTTEVFNDGTFGMSLGWEMNQPDYMSPRLSHQTIGKDGFTGTMFLADRSSHRCLVLLSNRTYPKRPNSPDAINAVRWKLQDLLML